MTAMALFEKGKKAYAALDEVGPIGSPEREKAKHETHVSIAAECLALARANGGIYNKPFDAGFTFADVDRAMDGATVVMRVEVTDHAGRTASDERTVTLVPSPLNL